MQSNARLDQASAKLVDRMESKTKLDQASAKLVDRIDGCLPQTQCTKCGYPRCRDYAMAVANGEANINQCPPGGSVTIGSLAKLLGRTPVELDRRYGAYMPRRRARIDEEHCIGCSLCIQACPVDAICGAAKSMHTVIADDCTGCELCLPPCPVDCIDMVPIADSDQDADSPWPGYSMSQVEQARTHVKRRLNRLNTVPASDRGGPGATEHKDRATIRAELHAAVARGRSKRSKAHPSH